MSEGEGEEGRKGGECGGVEGREGTLFQAEGIWIPSNAEAEGPARLIICSYNSSMHPCMRIPRTRVPSALD